jgi:hypothetical protein
MVLAFAVFLINFAGVSGVPAAVNYIVEAFTPALVNEAAAIMNLYRRVFGIGITFYLFDWAAAIGIQGVFGMMAFLTILVFGMVICVMIWGANLRKYSFVHADTEDNVKVN